MNLFSFTDYPNSFFVSVLNYSIYILNITIMKPPILFNSLIIAFLLFIGNVNSYAQTKLWGVGSSPSAGVAEAEFQTAFVNATVAGTYSTTQWTALTSMCQEK